MNSRIPKRCATSALTLSCILLFLVLAVSAAPPGTETRVSFSSCPSYNNFLPSADNGWIVWQESCAGDLHIIAYNYRTGVQLTLPNATLTSSSPNIKGNRVVWREDADDGGEITSLYYTDLTTSAPRARRLNLPPSYKTNPVVDGDTIVWEDKETSSSPTTQDILMYNIASSALYNLTPGTPDSSQTYPSLSGNRVVWLDDRNGQSDIFMNTTYNGWATVNVTPGIPGTQQHRPIINGDRIIWSDDANTLYLNDMATTTTLPSYSAGDKINNVAVCATYVAWKEQTGGSFGPWDIFVNNTASSSPPDQITDSGSQHFKGVYSNPVFSPVIITPDSRVIWVDRRDGNKQNIYMFTYGTPAGCPEVRISASPTEGPSPLLVRFNDLSSAPFTRWRWEFGDGSTATIKNTSHRYSPNGIYTARLIAATPYCRNASALQTISVGVPSVNFTGSPTEGIAPLTVAFTGTATGSPTDWLWDFGDGDSSNLQNPTHVFTSAGTYTVNLTATNSYGDGVKSWPGFITAREGLEGYSFTDVTGISVSGSGSSQSLTFDKTLLPAYIMSADKKTLMVIPPAGYGWQNITFISTDAAGFAEGPATITGSIGPTSLIIRDLQPATFSSGVGSNLKMNYHYEIGQYSSPAYLLSRVWEGTLPSDDAWFSNIVHRSSFSTKNVGYTMSITRNNLSVPFRLKLNLSASSGWEKGSTNIETGRSHTYVIAMGYDANGNRVGMVLPARFTGNDTVNHIEYFETDVPPEALSFSTFALAQLYGSGNPFQLITLSVTSHVEPPSPNPAPAPADSDSGGSGGAGQGAAVVATAAAPPAPSPSQAQVQPLMTAIPTASITDVISFPATLAAAKVQVPSPVTQQTPAAPPNTAVSIFTSMVAWIAGTVAGNAVVAAIVVVAGLAVYLFRKG